MSLLDNQPTLKISKCWKLLKLSLWKNPDSMREKGCKQKFVLSTLFWNSFDVVKKVASCVKLLTNTQKKTTLWMAECCTFTCHFLFDFRQNIHVAKWKLSSWLFDVVALSGFKASFNTNSMDLNLLLKTKVIKPKTTKTTGFRVFELHFVSQAIQVCWSNWN